MIEMAEGIESTWHYHLRIAGKTKALCGAAVMGTNSPLDSWGYKPTHIPHHYCQRCEELVKTEKENKP